MTFEFATSARIVFGAGSLQSIAAIAGEHGQRALVVTGRSMARAEPLLNKLKDRLVVEVFSISGEPTIEVVRTGVAACRRLGAELVVAIGGGSVLDAGKAVAGLATQEGSPLDYLEVIGRGLPLDRATLPFIAIPTTAGTGAEVTRNAVLTSTEHRLKVSLRSPRLLARAAIVNPELLRDLPSEVIAHSGLDALAQLIEPFVSRRANPLVDGLCREGIARSARSLQRMYNGERSPAVLEDLALASLFGGLALANAGLGAVHGFAAPIGGAYDAPHGAVCAALLPHVMAVNLGALRARDPRHCAIARFAEIARMLTGDDNASADDGIVWVRELTHALNVAGLAQFHVTTEAIPQIVQQAQSASSMKGNPLSLTDEELSVIVLRSL